MTVDALRTALANRTCVLLDGAMGTELQKAGMPISGCYESWNLDRPDIVRRIHDSYVRVGSQGVVTNTFQANPQALARHGLTDQLEAICQAAIDNARAALGTTGFVLASVGPMDLSNGVSDLQRTLHALRNADGFLLETWSSRFREAAEVATNPGTNPEELPVLLSLTFRASPESDAGSPLIPPLDWTAGQAAASVVDLPLAALGVNCGLAIGPPQILSILREYRQATDLPLLVRANAGSPALVEGGRFEYPRRSHELAQAIPRWIRAGALWMGGCCGTDPDCILAIREALDKEQEEGGICRTAIERRS